MTKHEFKKPLLDLAMSHIQAQYLLDGDIVQFQTSAEKALLALEELWKGQESWFDTYKSKNKEYEWEGFVGNIKPTDEKSFDGAKTKMEHIDEAFLYEKVDLESLQGKPKANHEMVKKILLEYTNPKVNQVVDGKRVVDISTCLEDWQYQILDAFKKKNLL